MKKLNKLREKALEIKKWEESPFPLPAPNGLMQFIPSFHSETYGNFGRVSWTGNGSKKKIYAIVIDIATRPVRNSISEKPKSKRPRKAVQNKGGQNAQQV